jgi:aminoglycoside phosphotransferase (APT) family kinase protein
VTLGALRAVAGRHGLRPPAAVPRPWLGATSAVYPLGSAVLKVPHAGPAAVEAVRVDAMVGAAAQAVGVRTPGVLAVVEAGAGDLLPVPYSLHERIRGRPLTRRAGSPAAAGAWREVGRDLARLHAGVPRSGPLAGLRSFAQSPATDPRPWATELEHQGVLTRSEARWLADLLDDLAPAALAAVPPAFCHGDVNAANVLVAPASVRFLALIDWAGAGWLDPAWDFAGVPLRAVPPMLAGHREVAALAHDATAEARIFWCHLQFALHTLRAHPAAPEVHRRRAARLVRRAREFGRATRLA